MESCRRSRLRFVRLASALAVVSVVTASAQAAEGPGFGDIGQAVAATVIFLLLLAVLGRWAWRPIVTQLRKREQEVASTVDRAAAKERQAEELLSQYRARMDRAEGEARGIIDGLREQAKSERERLLADARAESVRQADEIRAELERHKHQIARELFEETAEAATDLAGRIVGKTLDGEDHRRLVAESLEQIRHKAEEQD